MTGTAIAIDATAGNPSPGSVKLTIPFDGLAEQLIFQQLLNMDNNSMGDNLSGATISAQVRLDSTNASIDSSFNVKFALKATAAYVYAEGPSVTLQEGNWTTVTMAVDSAAQVAGFDTCHVFEIDLLINSGNSGTYMGSTVMHIDTIAVSSADGGVASDGGGSNEGGGGGDGGSDGGSSDSGGSSDGGGTSDSATDASGQ